MGSVLFGRGSHECEEKCCAVFILVSIVFGEYLLTQDLPGVLTARDQVSRGRIIGRGTPGLLYT